MDRALRAWAIAGAVLLASCGRADVSGVYLAKTDRSATLIQLAQDKAGAVTGRVEIIAIGQGMVDDESASLDAAASKQALAFKGDVLILSRNGAKVQARRSSLASFQKAVSQLKARAAEERRKAAEAQVAQAPQALDATAFGDSAGTAAKLHAATAALRADAAKLDDAVLVAPDFGRQAADATARIAQMAQTAPTLSRSDRARLAASASQLIVGTNQIDIARTQYAIGLDPIVQRAAPLATAVQRFCDTPPAARVAGPCAAANAAATRFESAQVRAAVVFKGYKQAVQAELSRQTQLAGRIAGQAGT